MNMRCTGARAALLAAALLSSSAQPVFAAQTTRAGEPALTRTFTERIESVTIENSAGRTQVQTWDDGRLKVSASRSGAGGGTAFSLDSTVRFERPSPSALKIVVVAVEQGEAVNLVLSVPKFVNLIVRGGEGDVLVGGVPNSVSVETGAGSISLRLPPNASTDLSARAVEGSITAQVPIVFFGALNTHVLDGKTGRGGAPVILRSERGSIAIIPDDVPRAMRADAPSSADSSAPSSGASAERQPKLAGPNGRGGSVLSPSEAGPSAPSESALADAASASPKRTLPAGANASDEDVIRVDSRVVSLNVRVADLSGKLVPNLTKADFQVFEDGAEQEITSFEPVSAPVSLVLLLDLSTSTKDRMGLIKRAAKKFIDSLNPNAPIAVAAFTRKFMLVCDFTQDRKLLKKRIDDTKNLHSGTAFYDAMWSTLDLFKETPAKRKAVVVLSDGVDNSLSYDNFVPRHSFDELAARIAQEDVTIYPIYFNTEYEATVKMRGQDSHESYVTARGQLQRIADDAGGTLFKAERAEDLESVYQLVASELQTLYTVAYNPKDKDYDGRWRSLSVKLKQPQATARTKRGYYAK